MVELPHYVVRAYYKTYMRAFCNGITLQLLLHLRNTCSAISVLLIMISNDVNAKNIVSNVRGTGKTLSATSVVLEKIITINYGNYCKVLFDFDET